VACLPTEHKMQKVWHGADLGGGDRKNELVFIGQEMDKATYLEELENCHLTKEVDLSQIPQ
jgi:hypothetical protein